MFYPIPEQKLKKQPPIKRVVVLVSTGERGEPMLCDRKRGFPQCKIGGNYGFYNNPP